MQLDRRDGIVLAGTGLFIFILGAAAWPILGVFSLVIQIAVLLMLVLYFQLYLHRKTLIYIERTVSMRARRQQLAHYRQTEALLSLFSFIRPRLPMPQMRGWAISPDFANYLITTIMQERPKMILEVGSGVSTVVMAYRLEMLGSGYIVSLEHDEKCAQNTQRLLEEHQLDKFARVVLAPLIPVTINARQWLWYDLSKLPTDTLYDMLVIDGPPVTTQSHARYPALPLMRALMRDSAVILLDDAEREQEREILAMWTREFTDLTVSRLAAEKGAARVTMGKGTNERPRSRQEGV